MSHTLFGVRRQVRPLAGGILALALLAGTYSPVLAAADTTPPPTPVAVSPLADATVNSTGGVNIDWTSVTDDSSNPVTYQFEYSSATTTNVNGSFTSPSWGVSGQTSSDLTGGFVGAAQGEYFWHVRATDSAGNASAWSTTSHFTVNNSTGTTTPPSTTPTLGSVGNLWPYDGQRLTTAEWTHSDWTDGVASSTPITYVYQSSLASTTNADGSFTTPIYTSGSLTASEIPTPGTPEGTYYWHVKMYDSAGHESYWSTMYRAIVDNNPSGDVTAPAAPTNLFPANGAVMTPADHDYVDWSTVTDPSEPVRYIWEYSWATTTNPDGGLTYPSFQSGPLTDSRIDIADPQGRGEGTFYWHARALDAAGNEGPWSTTWTYTVSSGATSTPGTGIATSSQTIVVRQSDLETETNPALAALNNSGKWFFYNDENDTINNGYGSFVTGPATAPLGSGSAQMTATGTERHNLATYGFKNVPLRDISGLSFSTYSQSLNNGATTSEQAPYLNFNVDFNNSDTWQRRLIFVPGDNGTVSLDTWQNWDAIAGGAAQWRYSGAVWPGTSDSGSTLKTWNQILALYPNAETRSTDSWFGFRVGEPYPNGFTGNVDNFSLTIANGTSTASTTVYDFEPAVATTTGNGGGGSGGNGGGGGGGSVLGTSSSGGGGSVTTTTTSGGEVLGASTDACAPIINSYMREGQPNDSSQVNTLKNFLNGELNMSLTADGFFDQLTTLSVDVFQLKHWQDVLLPWVPFGLPSATTPTGYVYKTTGWKINQIHCAQNNMMDPAKPILP